MASFKKAISDGDILDEFDRAVVWILCFLSETRIYRIWTKVYDEGYVNPDLYRADFYFMEEKHMLNKQINIELQDTQWQFEYVDHDRNIARAIVYDENGLFYFVRAERDDDFGKATLIETSGGGVEIGEDLQTAIQRELKEELGISVEIICKIGVVSDYYNLIHRHNINNYFLCKVKSFGEKNLTQDEIERFHLSTLKLTYDEAVLEYENRANTRLGILVANRELPILQRAKEIIDESQK